MEIKGIHIDSTVRITQPNDVFDVEFTLTSNATNVEIKDNLYDLWFFSLLNGDVSGDDVGGTLTLGVKFKFYNTQLGVICETTPVPFDWYKNETSYISDSISTVTHTLAADTRFGKVEMIAVLNEGGATVDKVLVSSTQLAFSSYASDDGAGNKGIALNMANGDVTCTGAFKFTKAIG